MESIFALIQDLEAAGGTVFNLVKIFCCGFMIGSALFYPLADEAGYVISTIALTLLILSAVAFHLLNLEPFVKVGVYTFSAALTFFLLALISAGPAKKDFIPWLPLFLVFTSLATVAIWKITEVVKSWPPSSYPPTDPEASFSSQRANDYDSDHSYQTRSSYRDRGPPSRSNRNNHEYFARYGPSSRYSGGTGPGQSTITLPHVGQLREGWESPVRRLFRPDERYIGATEIGDTLPNGLHNGLSNGLPNGVNHDLDHEGRLSHESSQGSDSPLLDERTS